MQRDFQLIESFGLTDGQYFVYDQHLKRLQQSAEHFGFKVDLSRIEGELRRLQQAHSENSWKVRLLLHRDGTIETEAAKIHSLPEGLAADVAEEPVDLSSPFLYHKTTNRDIYMKHKSGSPGIFDTLLWNIHREITEFTIGNLVVKLNGRLLTPPVECGLLNGTFRMQLLKEGTIQEEKILLDDLPHCSDVWLINSVRQWVPITMKYPISSI